MRRPAATAFQLLRDWPGDLDQPDLNGLIFLPAAQARTLAGLLMAALPAGPAGAGEARRLRDLLTVLRLLPVRPDTSEISALRRRYEQAGPLPASVALALDELSEFRKANPGPIATTFEEITAAGGFRGGSDQVTPEAFEGEVVRTWNPLPDEPEESPQRFFRMDVEGLERDEPLREDRDYTIAIGVALDPGPLIGSTAFPDEALADVYASVDLVELTVQLDSPDFEIIGRNTAALRVPRTGPSRGKARFDVSPRHGGDCRLTASVHYAGNFLAQINASIPVGTVAAAGATAAVLGRPPESMMALEPRDISLILESAPGKGYVCTALGSVGNQAVLPITAEELARAVDTAREALFSVVKSAHDGQPVFQTSLDIPAPARDAALRVLARAGARLFQRIFLHPQVGADARRVGEWLREYATNPKLRLTVQVFAADAPIPWAMLYLGDAAEGAELDWNLFLGMRHIIEQLPLRELPGTSDNAIRTSSGLALGLNINPTIDTTMGIGLVAEHAERWRATAAARGLTLIARSTRDEVVRALADARSSDQIIYFYCHATSGALGADPDSASIVMGGRADALTLGDLNLDAPTAVQLPGRPLVFINACESAELSPRFYSGFVPYFLAKGARGVIGTECRTPVLLAIDWADAFFERFLDGARLGETVLDLRQAFLLEHGNPLGLLYGVYCDTDTRIAPGLPRKDAAGAH